MRNTLIIIAVTVVLVYGGICLFLYANQKNMIYYGSYTRTDAATTDFALQRPDATLRGWVVNPGKPDPILYFGGNGESVELNRDDFARWFPDRSVYLLAYRGYGASDGEPSESVLVPDALAFFDYVQKQHPQQRIAVVGRSLGSGVASQVASQRQIERLVLITPFDSLVGAAKLHYPIIPVGMLMHERYDSANALRDFDKPFLILHGGRDDVVPEASTLRLIEALSVKPKVLRFADAGHNDISDNAEYEKAMIEFLR
jgi:uncharacterized protein